MPRSGNSHSSDVDTELTNLLAKFGDGDREALGELARRFNTRFQKMAARVAPDLVPRGLVEDAVQELWSILLEREGLGFDPSRGTALNYLTTILARDAVRAVRAKHTPPGQRTRAYKDAATGEKGVPVPALSLDAGNLSNFSRLHRPGEAVQLAAKEYAEAESATDLAMLISAAWQVDPNVADALNFVFRNDVTLTEAARILGVERTTLRRRTRQCLSALLVKLAA